MRSGMSNEMRSRHRTSVPRPSRDEAKAATRAALIRAGIAEFDGEGLDVSLDAICERAGVTRGAFYVHFADRNDFIIAVMDQLLTGFVAALTAVPTGGIQRVIQLYFAAASARSPAVAGGTGLRMQHVLEACRRSKKVGDAYRGLLVQARDRLAGALEHDREAGTLRADLDPRALADLLVIAALGLGAAFELELPVAIDRIGPTLVTMLSAR